MTKKEFLSLKPGDKVVVGKDLKSSGIMGIVVEEPYGTGVTINMSGIEKRYHHKNLLKVPGLVGTTPRTYVIDEGATAPDDLMRRALTNTVELLKSQVVIKEDL